MFLSSCVAVKVLFHVVRCRFYGVVITGNRQIVTRFHANRPELYDDPSN
jgi:hypothetical protein